MTSFEDVQRRWDSFLVKIEDRFHEILSQTETVLPGILEMQDFDTTPFSVAWQGIESQAKSLLAKIEETWYNNVSNAFDEVKEAQERSGIFLQGYHKEFYPAYYGELNKGMNLRNKLSKELIGYEVRTYCEAARKLQKKAMEILNKEFFCTQCKAPLQVRPNFFRSYYQPCEYCQAVNTFEPGTIARNIEHFALHPLANEKALHEYFAYIDIEDRFRNQREDQPKTITPDMVLEAQRKYASKYLRARIEIIPEYEKHFDKDLEVKVGHVRRWIIGAYR